MLLQRFGTANKAKLIVAFSVLFLLVAYGRGNCDEVRPIRVEFDSNEDVKGYRLYRNNEFVCETASSTDRYIECNVYLTEAPMEFTLTALSNEGVESVHSSPYVLRLPSKDNLGNFIPVAKITAGLVAGDAPLTVNFDGNNSFDLEGELVSYQWDFADGQMYAGTTVEHVFTMPGEYVVTLSVIDDLGALASSSIVVTVTGEAVPGAGSPIAEADVSPVDESATLMQFDASGSSDPDGEIVKYAWDFGDGVAGEGSIVTHEYMVAGEYNVVLRVTDNEGNYSDKKLIVTIEKDADLPNLPPVSIISTSEKELQAHIEWVYPEDENIAGFRIYKNPDILCETSDPKLRSIDCPIFLESGYVEFFMTAVDKDGMETDISNVFSLETVEIAPIVTEGNAPLNIIFNGNSSYDPDGSIVSYDWDFGDGKSDSGAVIIHTFEAGGLYTISLTVTDDQGDVAVSTFELSVIAVNTPPVAIGGTLGVDIDSSLSGMLSASDAEGNPLTFSIVRNGSKGTATIKDEKTGMFTYEPNQTSDGADSFTFKVNDGIVDSVPATVTINIRALNQDPVAVDDSIATAVDTPVTIDISANDSDPDDDTLALVNAGPAGDGNVSFSGNNITYTPNSGFIGTDSFKYTINDGRGGTAEGTVTVNVKAENTVPEVNNLTLELEEDLPVDGTMIGNDADGDSLLFMIVAKPTKGTLKINDPAAGTFTYTPYPNENGTDLFTYRASDGVAQSEAATVTINIKPVNDVPVAVDDSAYAKTNTPVPIDVLSNDTDNDDEGLTIISVEQPQNGSAEISDGKIRYTPNPGYIGSDSFGYTVEDGSGANSSGIITVTVSTTGTNNITVSWDYISSNDLDGFKLYMNGQFVCESKNPASRELTCVVPDGVTPKKFTLTAVSLTGDETAMSNEIIFIAGEGTVPEGEQILVQWDYETFDQLAGFKLYLNDQALCETQDPNAREMVCGLPATDLPVTFTLSAVTTTGEESTMSRTILYDPSLFQLPDNTEVDEKYIILSDRSRTIAVDVLGTASEQFDVTNVSYSGDASVINDGKIITYTPGAVEVESDQFYYTRTDLNGNTISGMVQIIFSDVEQKQVTFWWEYDGDLGITGFRFYLNGEFLCETLDPEARKLTCPLRSSDGPLEFTLKTLGPDGEEGGL